MAPLCPRCGLGSTPSYPTAGNCVPLSSFDFRSVLVFCFCCCGLVFFISDLQLVQTVLAAGDCRKKKSKHERKKKALPKPKDLKTKPTWRGMERILLSWRPMESTSVYESNRSPKGAALAGWASLFCVSYFCVHSWVQVCLHFAFFNV